MARHGDCTGERKRKFYGKGKFSMVRLQDSVSRMKNGKPAERFYTGEIRKARKVGGGHLPGTRLPTCFAHYQDSGPCLAQNAAVCRICKEATFIWLRLLHDARLAEREKALREFLHLSEAQLKELRRQE